MKIQLETDSIVIFESSLYQTTTTLVKLDNIFLLVDPNWLPIEIDFIKNYIIPKKGNKPLYLIFTHSDFDHIIGAGAFDCEGMIASFSFVNEVDQQKVLEDIYSFDQSYYVKRDYPIYYPQPTVIIKDKQQQVQVAGEELIFYLTPGHTKDSMVIYIRSLKLLIVGDYLSDIEFPFIENISEYESTLKVLEDIISTEEINYLVPGHGSLTKDRKEMKRRIEDSKQYINDLQHHKPIEGMLKGQYDFYDGMKQFHELNKLLIKDN